MQDQPPLCDLATFRAYLCWRIIDNPNRFGYPVDPAYFGWSTMACGAD